MECFFIVTALWIFSVCLHEFGHAFVAYRGGDYTIPEKGYLTLNPLKYTHPVYSLAMPLLFMFLGGIGLPGGAVYINRELLRSRSWDTWVSLAGPAVNVLLIIVIAVCFKAGIIPARNNLATYSMALLLQLQISAVLLNLLPIPPLDGFQALAPWLPRAWSDQLHSMANVAFLVLFVALWYVPALNEGFWFLVYFCSESLGVPRSWGWAGWELFQFWKRG